MLLIITSCLHNTTVVSPALLYHISSLPLASFSSHLSLKDFSFCSIYSGISVSHPCPRATVSLTVLPQADGLVPTVCFQPCLFCRASFCLQILPEACSRGRSEFPARFIISEELHQAPRMEVPLPCPVAVVKAEVMGLIHGFYPCYGW